MAGRTVRVRGLPAELPPDRLADKLTIHFLRSRNGGGEIADVQVLPGACALITFEAAEGNGRSRAPGPGAAVPRSGRARLTGPVSGPVPFSRSGPADPEGRARAVGGGPAVPAGGDGARRGAQPRRGTRCSPRDGSGSALGRRSPAALTLSFSVN